MLLNSCAAPAASPRRMRPPPLRRVRAENVSPAAAEEDAPPVASRDSGTLDAEGRLLAVGTAARRPRALPPLRRARASSASPVRSAHARSIATTTRGGGGRASELFAR
jgi:hypothetical protein